MCLGSSLGVGISSDRDSSLYPLDLMNRSDQFGSVGLQGPVFWRQWQHDLAEVGAMFSSGFRIAGSLSYYPIEFDWL
jgi:hypothetical protein